MTLCILRESSFKMNNNTFHKVRFLLQAAVAAFGAYFCMYAFRKPFTVATFEGLTYWGIDYKILLIIAQILGYTLSKFIGIKVISEMPRHKRTLCLLGFIGFAELALLGFALIPAPYNIACLFLNGLPLGMIWGIVFSYLEGRKTSEVLGVILCSSFIVSSGMVKSLGKYLMDTWEITEYWMPFATGLCFLAPLLFFAYLLEKLPAPSVEDRNAKTARRPLLKSERIMLYKQFALPLTLVILFYMMLTAIRDFRDNFAREIWDALGFSESASVYTVSEVPITLIVLGVLMSIGAIANNKKAFRLYHVVLVLGCFSILMSTMCFQTGWLSPLTWMIISGFGLYSCYVPFNGLYFDRMIATFKINGNVGFLIYMADAFGYLGSIAVLLYKNFGQADVSWLGFFVYSLYVIGFTGVFIAVICWWSFQKSNTNQIHITLHESVN